MVLEIIWFALVVILFMGFFFLDGFDYGIGILLPFIARKENSRRMVINTIGGVWDGNEVWLIAAGGAIFAAFPYWYATMFSGFYFALLAILVALALRGISFEFRGKSKFRIWRRTFDGTFFLGSLLLALLWGVFVGNLLHGVPINAQMEYTGNFGTLLNVYSLLCGVLFVFIFAMHGGSYLRMKIPKNHKVMIKLNNHLKFVHRLGSLIFLGFLIWTCFVTPILSDPVGLPLAAVSFVLFLASGIYLSKPHPFNFICTSLSVITIVACVFLHNFPNVLISTTNHAYSLTVFNASASSYSLWVMLIVAIILVPIIIIYQCLAYWFFRHRVNDDPGYLEY